MFISYCCFGQLPFSWASKVEMPLPGTHKVWPGQDFNDRGHSLGTSVLKGPTEFIKTDEKKQEKRVNRGETLNKTHLNR